MRCVIPVHLFGRTVDMDPIMDLARARACTSWRTPPRRTARATTAAASAPSATPATFSFYPAKNLGAWGDAGAVITDDEKLAERVRLIRSHGESPRYHHRLLGTTGRLDAIQAAVLRIKLAHLDGANDAGRRIAAQLREASARCPG